MGFTFSHPAAVIPFKYLPRKWYSVTGLIAGSIVPDIEYFIRWNTISRYSHTLYGLFWFDIPMAIVISVVFHSIIRDSLISNLPEFLKIRLAKYLNNNWVLYLKKNRIVVLYSILVGAFTHLLWDSFTAGNGYFVRYNMFFMNQYFVLERPIYFYKIVKHVSSLLGTIAILYQLYKMPKSNFVEKNEYKYYWPVIMILSILIIFFRLHFSQYELSFNSIVKIIISSGLLSLILLSLHHGLYIRLKSGNSNKY